MPNRKLAVVFVHGWSVTHTDTYGRLPERLKAEAAAHGLSIAVRDVHLAEYVSFHDEVRIEDVSRAMEAAVRSELGDLLERGERFAAITHSTGGPLMRDWLERYYGGRDAPPSPLSHLVMLAPANFGSALAALGKGRVGRLKSWVSGVEPGQGVLDWLELGSPEAWALNEAWIAGRRQPAKGATLAFVLTGQTIDRKLYDALNSYTGELGSDGVVRVAAANLNAAYVRLEEQPDADDDGVAELRVTRASRAPRTAFRLISGASHSGKDRGIMRSVQAEAGAAKGAEVANAILRCLAVDAAGPDDATAAYSALCDAFASETDAIHLRERVELEGRLLLRDRVFVHDRMTQLIFRVRDDNGHAVNDFDLLLTGEGDDPNQLPPGFFVDRQRNQRARNTITYLLNHDVMAGSPPVVHEGDEIRPAQPGLEVLGLRLVPRPAEGFVHYGPSRIRASRSLATSVLRPDETVLVDIVVRRVVHENVVRLTTGFDRRSFKGVKPGDPLEAE